MLTGAGCRVEVSTDPDTILSNAKVKALIGDKCDGVIGQLTEVRGAAAVWEWGGTVVGWIVRVGVGVLLAGRAGQQGRAKPMLVQKAQAALGSLPHARRAATQGYLPPARACRRTGAPSCLARSRRRAAVHTATMQWGE